MITNSGFGVRKKQGKQEYCNMIDCQKKQNKQIRKRKKQEIQKYQMQKKNRQKLLDRKSGKGEKLGFWELVNSGRAKNIWKKCKLQIMKIKNSGFGLRVRKSKENKSIAI